MDLARTAAVLNRSKGLVSRCRRWAGSFCIAQDCTSDCDQDRPSFAGVWRRRILQAELEITSPGDTPPANTQYARAVTLRASLLDQPAYVRSLQRVTLSLTTQLGVAAVVAASAGYNGTLLLCDFIAPPMAAASRNAVMKRAPIASSQVTAPELTEHPSTLRVREPNPAQHALLTVPTVPAVPTTQREPHAVRAQAPREPAGAIKAREPHRSAHRAEVGALASSRLEGLSAASLDPTPTPAPATRPAPEVLPDVIFVASHAPDRAEEQDGPVTAEAPAAVVAPPRAAETPAPPSAANAQVVLALASVHGALTRRRAQRGLARIEPELARCLHEGVPAAAAFAPWTMRTTIDLHGRARATQIEGPAAQRTRTCLERTVRHMQVEVPDTGEAVVEWSLMAAAR